MDNLELVSFQIISAVGVAKSSYIEAMKIAESKMQDLNAADIEAATRMIEGTARSMGIEIVD